MEREAQDYLSSLRARNRLPIPPSSEEPALPGDDEMAASLASELDNSCLSTNVADDLGLFLQQELRPTTSSSDSSGGEEENGGEDAMLDETNLDHMLDPMSLASLFDESGAAVDAVDATDVGPATTPDVAPASDLETAEVKVRTVLGGQ